MESPSARHSVFISYSRRDRRWLDRLNIHLRPLVRDGVIEVWDDSKITPGSAWKDEINRALSSARVALLLISADFMASDFIRSKEIPPLLQAAENEGAVILPLIVSASRFIHIPELAQFQSVNDPTKPLNSLSRSEQEKVLVRTTEVIERVMAGNDSQPVPWRKNGSQSSLFDNIPLGECLVKLGCNEDLVNNVEKMIFDYLNKQLNDKSSQRNNDSIREYLKSMGETESVVSAVNQFLGHMRSCFFPQQWGIYGFYLSTKKVSETFRSFEREIRSLYPLSDFESTQNKFEILHKYLVAKNRLLFLPAQILIASDLSNVRGQIIYFSGSFKLDVNETEVQKVPGAADIVSAGDSRNMYGVVTHVLNNTDPFIYPLLQFTGHLGLHPVNMILSRKYIRLESGTASFLVSALLGESLEISGIGLIQKTEASYQLHPFACNITY